MLFGRKSFCFVSFSISTALTLSVIAKFRFFSSSEAFSDLVTGQKKMLTPEGQSGRIQKKSLFQRLAMNEELGLKATLFR